MTDKVGSVIAHYRLDELLGDGGMGTVYRAYDLNLERAVALKLMHAHYARRTEFRARLTQEAKTAAQLDHVSIVSILDFGEFNGDLYIAMEYVDGGNLRAHLRRLQSKGRFLPFQQSLQIGAQIADALHYAHHMGVVHRDVKPSNIILKRLNKSDEPGGYPFRAILTDFGLVKLLDGDSMTQSGLTMGTPTYMSPEQCKGLALDGRSDLYSLGVVLYELATNHLPFEFKSLSEAMIAHMRGDKPIPPRQIREDLPAYFDNILKKALANDAGDRFDSGRRMADVLRSAKYSLDDLPTQTMEQSGEIPAAALGRDKAPRGYRLRIDAPGHEYSVAELSLAEISIGRDADNDIVLPADGVSRRHALIQWIESRWVVQDLGGMNGTWLGGRRLVAGEFERFVPGSILEIGPYRLEMVSTGQEKGIIAAASFAASQQRDLERVIEADADGNIKPLALYLARESIIVDPGLRKEIALEVVNHGELDDRVTPKIRGLPAAWVTLPHTFVRVARGESVTIPLIFHPPRHTESRAGRQRFRIELVSQQYGDLEAAISATLILDAFESFEMTMEPRRIHLPDSIRVTVRNTGNATTEFSVVGREREGQVQILGERGGIALEPGQTATVDLQLKQRQRPLFGSGKTFRYSVEVASKSGAQQSISGRATATPMLSSGIIYLAVFLVVFLCVLVALVLFFQRDRLGFGSTSSGTTSSDLLAATISSAGTETAVYTTSDEARETEIAATLAVTGDQDNDGLSDSQEEYLGTDPGNPDTDQDQLSDGEELLTWSTNPLKKDTDGDQLSDMEEVRLIGTSPTNHDSDGDGVSDGDEIVYGSDPLNPSDPTPATIEPSPTIIDTPSPEIPADTATPTDEPTSTPSATSTQTPSPTNTPESTATSTDTPTETPIPAATNTGTATAIPQAGPALSCIEVAPNIDGSIQIPEWGTAPILVFAPDGDVTRPVVVYVMRDETRLYLASNISDPTTDPSTDSFGFYIDANNSSGDPDESDRLFEVLRDGTPLAWSGIGSSDDLNGWSPVPASDNWRAATGETGRDTWTVEMEVEIETELPLIVDGDPFSAMILVQYTGHQSSWPEAADINRAGTWLGFENLPCP